MDFIVELGPQLGRRSGPEATAAPSCPEVTGAK